MQSLKKMSEKYSGMLTKEALGDFTVKISEIKIHSRVKELIELGLAAPFRDSNKNILIRVGSKYRLCSNNEEFQPVGAVSPISIDFLN